MQKEIIMKSMDKLLLAIAVVAMVIVFNIGQNNNPDAEASTASTTLYSE